MFKSLKKFILSLSLFTVFLFSYFIGIFIINYNISDNISIDKKDIIIVGDSRLGASLNPKQMRSAQNICQNAEPYYLTYLKLKFLFDKNVNPDTVIIGFGHHNISNYNEYKLKDEFWTDRMFNTTYLLSKEILNIQKIEIDYLQLFLIYSRNMCLIPKSDHYKSFIGEFQERKGHHTINNYQNRIDQIFYYKDYDVSELCISYLDSIVHISVKNQITPILIATPVPDAYYELIPATVIERYDLIKARYLEEGIRVIDLTRSKYSKDYFYNADHLNTRGARRFTGEVKKILSDI
tara:strand:+ start:140 stop:1018 length:879 start_codon:yes stop_codon:yes gene_type:complete